MARTGLSAAPKLLLPSLNDLSRFDDPVELPVVARLAAERHGERAVGHIPAVAMPGAVKGDRDRSQHGPYVSGAAILGLSAHADLLDAREAMPPRISHETPRHASSPAESSERLR
jgi:hypothetical protein